MKKIIVLFCLLFGLVSCTSATEFGRCVGLNGRKDPGLIYEFSARNIAVGIFTVSLIVPPIFVVLDQLECPVAKNPEYKPGGTR